MKGVTHSGRCLILYDSVSVNTKMLFKDRKRAFICSISKTDLLKIKYGILIKEN